MINEIVIQGLKSIAEIQIRCSNFNLFVGTNSSGKSTALQALLLVVQNLELKCGLNGPLVSLGEFREAKSFHVNKQKIDIKIQTKEEKMELEIADSNKIAISSTPKNSSISNILNYNNHKIDYLSCNRIGCRDTYQKNMAYSEELGNDGEYAIHYLSEHKSDRLESDLVKFKEESFTMLHQVNAWLNYIVGANIQVENILYTDVVKAEYSMLEGKYVRPKNVGSGVSYLISILILGMKSKKGGIVIIENPELHLHPLSQSRLCEFLYFIAQANRQVFIETHSDHFFNGIRAGIATNQMKEDKIAVNFFTLDQEFCTQNYEIKFGKRGKVLTPKENLFEQFDIDLDKMLGI